MTDQKKTVRTIHAVAVIARIGKPGTLDSDLSVFSAQECVFNTRPHEQLGPGVWIAHKDQKGIVTFVPTSNFARITYTEREEPIA